MLHLLTSEGVVTAGNSYPTPLDVALHPKPERRECDPRQNATAAVFAAQLLVDTSPCKEKNHKVGHRDTIGRFLVLFPFLLWPCWWIP